MIFPLTNSDQDSQTGDNFGVTAARGIYLQQYYKVAPKYLKILNNIKNFNHEIGNMQMLEMWKYSRIVRLHYKLPPKYRKYASIKQCNNVRNFYREKQNKTLIPI